MVQNLHLADSALGDRSLAGKDRSRSWWLRGSLMQPVPRAEGSVPVGEISEQRKIWLSLENPTFGNRSLRQGPVSQGPVSRAGTGSRTHEFWKVLRDRSLAEKDWSLRAKSAQAEQKRRKEGEEEEGERNEKKKKKESELGKLSGKYSRLSTVLDQGGRDIVVTFIFWWVVNSVPTYGSYPKNLGLKLCTKTRKVGFLVNSRVAFSKLCTGVFLQGGISILPPTPLGLFFELGTAGRERLGAWTWSLIGGRSLNLEGFELGLETLTTLACHLCSFTHVCKGSSLQAGTSELAYATYARSCVRMLKLPPTLSWHKLDYTINCPLGTINYSSHALCFIFLFQSLLLEEVRIGVLKMEESKTSKNWKGCKTRITMRYSHQRSRRSLMVVPVQDHAVPVQALFRNKQQPVQGTAASQKNLPSGVPSTTFLVPVQVLFLGFLQYSKAKDHHIHDILHGGVVDSAYLTAVRGFGSWTRGFEWRRGFGVIEASWIRSGGVRGLGREGVDNPEGSAKIHRRLREVKSVESGPRKGYRLELACYRGTR
uniref:Uncharacterized protein n=1 Tax=Ananas comosus var. bracteatus TaxID=296719 RepID=A0A6V7QM04_ANACO|nr:unnamed protein product [Ananas comosus var. bracteatus]